MKLSKRAYSANLSILGVAKPDMSHSRFGVNAMWTTADAQYDEDLESRDFLRSSDL
jgi:hypothetical protein